MKIIKNKQPDLLNRGLPKRAVSGNKPVNQHYIGFPKHLQMKTIEIVSHFFEGRSRKTDLKITEFDQIRYFDCTGNFHTIIAYKAGRKYVLSCLIY